MSNFPGNYGQQGYNSGPYGQNFQARPGYQGMHGYHVPPGQPQNPGYGQGYPGQQPLHSASMGGYPSAPPHGIAPPPGADPTLWNWFITVDNDKSGQITSNELKQALVNGNWTHFNDETCRLMISMFDKDQSGTINFQEFCNLWTYIQQWKGVFDRYDMDHSGAIETHELQTALNDMGYRLSPIFTNILITRFDTVARRSMKLDSFIQCCVMLRLLTDAFRLQTLT